MTFVRTYSRHAAAPCCGSDASHAPQLLLLDEPYTGLDLVAADSLNARHRPSRRGLWPPLLLTSHALENAALTGRRAVVLLRGRVVYDGAITDPAVFATHCQTARVSGDVVGTACQPRCTEARPP